MIIFEIRNITFESLNLLFIFELNKFLNLEF